MGTGEAVDLCTLSSTIKMPCGMAENCRGERKKHHIKNREGDLEVISGIYWDFLGSLVKGASQHLVRCRCLGLEIYVISREDI